MLELLAKQLSQINQLIDLSLKDFDSMRSSDRKDAAIIKSFPSLYQQKHQLEIKIYKLKNPKQK